MQAIQQEAPSLIVTLAVMTLVGLLLALKVIPPGDTLVTGTVPVIVSYWFLRGAFQYQPPAPTVVTVPTAQAPQATVPEKSV